MNRSKLALFGAAATLVLAWGNAAFGQAVSGDKPADKPADSTSASPEAAQTGTRDTADPSSADLAQIVVTAERRNENIQKVPIAVTAITAKQITDQGIVTNQDIQLVTPGMTFESGYAFSEPYIRGIGTSQPNIGLESAIASYVDGAYQVRSYGQIGHLFDMQDIQVLKGAQGTLWGRNATGGAILYTTAQPVLGEFSGNASAEYGNYQHTLGEIALNIPFGDKLALRIGGQGSWDEGYITNIVNGAKWGGGSHGLGRATLKWQPTDEFSATVMYEKLEDKRRVDAFAERASFPQCSSCGLPGGGFNPVSGFYNIAYGPAATPLSVMAETTILTLAYKGALIDVNSVTSYRRDDTGGVLNVAGSSLSYEDVNSTEGGKTWGEELQAVSHLDGMLNGMLGFSVSGDTGTADFGITGALLQNVPGVHTYNTVETHSYSAFGELYAQPIERLKFTLGARYTDDLRTLSGTDSQIAAAIFAGNPAASNFRREATFSEVTPRFVVAYDFGAVNLYASYNRGFKEGGFNAPVFATEDPVKPETVDYYEAGAKYISPDSRLRLNAAAYYYKYKDIQVSILDVSTGTNILENAAAARAYGGEFEASYNVAPWLNVFGNISLLDSKFTSYSAGAVVNITPSGIVPAVENLNGFRLPRAPSVLGSLGGDLHVPIADNLTAHFNAVAHYTSSYDFSPGAGGPSRYARQDPYWLVNLSGYIEKEVTGSTGTFHPKYYRVGFFADNATDTRYYGLRQAQAFIGLLDNAAPPATYGLRVSVGF